MRYEKGHKDTTHQRILTIAAKTFREQGIAGAGLAGIMAEAGLTNGAFYAHFPSKEALVREALGLAFSSREKALARDGRTDLETVLRQFLGIRHRDNRGVGCPIAALAGEIARHPLETRADFGARVLRFIDGIAALLPEAPEHERLDNARAISGLMIGTLQLARAIPDEAASTALLESGIKAALALAGTEPAT